VKRTGGSDEEDDSENKAKEDEVDVPVVDVLKDGRRSTQQFRRAILRRRSWMSVSFRWRCGQIGFDC
jgi:hypothetical protein